MGRVLPSWAVTALLGACAIFAMCVIALPDETIAVAQRAQFAVGELYWAAIGTMAEGMNDGAAAVLQSASPAVDWYDSLNAGVAERFAQP